MKSLSGMTFMACWVGALALAGCSSGGVEAPVGSASTLSEALQAPPPPENPCALVDCFPNSICEVDENGEAVCVPVDPGEGNESVFCGGIAAIECPGAGTCVDDPADDCDPASGGADCGGVCECSGVLLLCVPGTVFDDSPDVCACVGEPEPDPCASVRCPGGTHCEVQDDGVVCAPDEPNPCALVLCAPGTTCEVVGDQPVCTPTEPGGGAPACGGIAGIACPGAGTCVDDPADDCDPENGGADCGGVCECSGVLLLCIEGTVFDDSPDVCACVPGEVEPDPCAAVTCRRGSRCEVHDGEAHCVSRRGGHRCRGRDRR